MPNPLVEFDSPRSFENADGTRAKASALVKLGDGLRADCVPAAPAPGEPSYLKLSLTSSGGGGSVTDVSGTAPIVVTGGAAKNVSISANPAFMSVSLGAGTHATTGLINIGSGGVALAGRVSSGHDSELFQDDGADGIAVGNDDYCDHVVLKAKLGGWHRFDVDGATVATVTGTGVSMGAGKVLKAHTPSAGDDVATKSYADGVAGAVATYAITTSDDSVFTAITMPVGIRKGGVLELWASSYDPGGNHVSTFGYRFVVRRGGGGPASIIGAVLDLGSQTEAGCSVTIEADASGNIVIKGAGENGTRSWWFALNRKVGLV